MGGHTDLVATLSNYDGLVSACWLAVQTCRFAAAPALNAHLQKDKDANSSGLACWIELIDCLSLLKEIP